MVDSRSNLYIPILNFSPHHYDLNSKRGIEGFGTVGESF